MSKYRCIGEITSNPISDKKIIRVATSGEDETYLKEEAAAHNTSIAEIIRVLIKDHIEELKSNRISQPTTHKPIGQEDSYARRIFFRVFYGIKTLNPNGPETPHAEYTNGKLYKTVDYAIKAQKILFESQVEEIRNHPKPRRDFEQAFALIKPVCLYDGNRESFDVGDALEEDISKRIENSRLILNGSEI